MKRAALLALPALLLVIALVALRLAGAVEETSAVTGMTSSWLGPLYVLVYLLTVVCAPILGLAAIARAVSSLPQLRQ